MRTLLCCLILAVFVLSPAAAAEQSWVGTISDSDCGAKHMAGTEHEKAMTDADCTKACIAKGAKYVFVNEGKVLNISNQDFVDLPQHAGHKVKLTGEMTNDSIRITKLEMPKK